VFSSLAETVDVSAGIFGFDMLIRGDFFKMAKMGHFLAKKC
jgi:hypothetical protein